MGWDAPDLYHQPETFDLSVVGTVNWTDESWTFDFSVVWQHDDGAFYLGTDSGCSCPSPFEGFTLLSDAEGPYTASEIAEHIQQCLQARRGGYGFDERAEFQVVDLISRIVVK